MDRTVIRSRSIRQSILRMLVNTFEANPDAHVLLDQIYEGFSTGSVQFDRMEIQAEVGDLRSRGLLEIIAAPGYERPCPKALTVTAKGRDFYRAGCPWEKVDEFTGNQRI